METINKDQKIIAPLFLGTLAFVESLIQGNDLLEHPDGWGMNTLLSMPLFVSLIFGFMGIIAIGFKLTIAKKFLSIAAIFAGISYVGIVYGLIYFSAMLFLGGNKTDRHTSGVMGLVTGCIVGGSISYNFLDVWDKNVFYIFLAISFILGSTIFGWISGYRFGKSAENLNQTGSNIVP